MPFTKIDKYIGNRVRLRRKMLGISQWNLADRIGVSFQQVQKYESGENRIAGSKIYKISKILNISPIFLFEGLEGIKINNHIFPEDLPVVKIVHNINNLKNKKIQKLLVELILEIGK